MKREFGLRTLVTDGEQMDIKGTILKRLPTKNGKHALLQGRKIDISLLSRRSDPDSISNHHGLPDAGISLFISTSKRFPVEPVRRHTTVAARKGGHLICISPGSAWVVLNCFGWRPVATQINDCRKGAPGARDAVNKKFMDHF